MLVRLVKKLACGQRRISGRRFSPPDDGQMISVTLDIIGQSLPSPCTASFQALSVNAFSVTYPRRTAGRRLDSLGVRMRESFCIFEKFPRSTEIIYK